MGAKGEGPGARDHPLRYRGWAGSVCAEGTLGGTCHVEWAGWRGGREKKRVTGRVASR